MGSETKTAGYSPVSVANKFIELAKKNTGKGLYLLPLIKLSYIAHGITLALTDRPLCNEPVEVWQYGPVFPSIFHAFKESNHSRREDIIKDKIAGFTGEEENIIELTYKNYGGLDSFILSNITHKEGTPWKESYNKKLRIIPNELIKKYYQEIAK